MSAPAPRSTQPGAVLVEAVHGGNFDTKADAQAGGADVSVGAAIAVAIVLERSSASCCATSPRRAMSVSVRAT